MTPSVLELDNAIREYAWGSVTAIPNLLGVPPTGRPAAELWIGAHPDEPSHWATHPDRPGLDEVLAGEPEQLLGTSGVAEFGPRLPFLMKVLAAGKALSLQVHPNTAQAQAGFAAEEQAGVPRNSPERNYSDAHHKPEIAYALSDFDAFCGFRDPALTADFFLALDVPELLPYCSLLTGDGGLRATFTTLLTLRGDARDRLVAAAIEGCRRVAATGGEWAPAAAASVLAASDFPGDVGAVLALLLNYVRLAPGEAIFLGAGNVHAYLRGTCIEVLANSDNVLRCGLTPKHVDVPELLRIADFSVLSRPRWEPVAVPSGQRFDVGVPDFALTVLELAGEPVALSGDGPHLVLAGEDRVELAVAESRVALAPWRAAFVAAGARPSAVTGTGRVFVAATNI